MCYNIHQPSTQIWNTSEASLYLETRDSELGVRNEEGETSREEKGQFYVLAHLLSGSLVYISRKRKLLDKASSPSFQSASCGQLCCLTCMKTTCHAFPTKQFLRFSADLGLKGPEAARYTCCINFIQRHEWEIKFSKAGWP